MRIFAGATLADLPRAGYTDPEIVEIVGTVALNVGFRLA